MASKKTVVTQVGSALGAAAARVENFKPKRSSGSKHSKAKAPVIDEKIAIGPQISEREDVEITAYLYAESRGFQGGSQDEDWIRAEQEVRQRRAAKS